MEESKWKQVSHSENGNAHTFIVSRDDSKLYQDTSALRMTDKLLTCLDQN